MDRPALFRLAGLPEDDFSERDPESGPGTAKGPGVTGAHSTTLSRVLLAAPLSLLSPAQIVRGTLNF